MKSLRSDANANNASVKTTQKEHEHVVCSLRRATHRGCPRMHDDLTSLSEEVILERQVTSVLAVMSRLNQGTGQLK